MRGANDEQTSRARSLRRNSTDAEGKLWHHLRARQLGGWKFVRQQPVGRYFVDFVCRERHLMSRSTAVSMRRTLMMRNVTLPLMLLATG